MNIVSGKVLVKETGVGLPDLLVSVYDLDPNTKPEDVFDFANRGYWQNVKGDRLGSVVTDEVGRFSLQYEDTDFQIRNEERRPDLALIVTAPEEPPAAAITDMHNAAQWCPVILHLSCGIRQNAGRTENFIIRLPLSVLQKADIRPTAAPGRVEKPESVIAHLRDAAMGQANIEDGLRNISAMRIDRQRTLVQGADKNVQNLLATLSAVPVGVRNSLNYVGQDQSVEAATQKVIETGIETVVKRSRMTGTISLAESEIDNFVDKNGMLKTEIAANEIEPLLFDTPNGQTRRIALTRQDPIALLCRERTPPDDQCREISEQDEPPGDAREDSGSNASPNGMPSDSSDEPTSEPNVPAYIGKLMRDITSPESSVAYGKGVRASLGDVQHQVDGFNLRSGPADVPAYYDFYNLQIAFEHVWHEAFDAGLLSASKDAYRRIVELGGKAPDGSNGIGGLLEEGQRAVDAGVEDPPENVVRLFDITWEQWNILTSEQQQGLVYWAIEIIFLVTTIHEKASAPPSSDQAWNEAMKRRIDADRMLLRQYQDWGKQIVRYAETRLESGDFHGLHKLLDELQDRLKEPYAFTIYAANRSERSVNFGILVNYRQKWTPLSYQAGKLIKTIPLAPKEVRKFTKKQIVKKSRSEKEIENNLRSRKEEASDISRAESEIVRKAQNATNFKQTAEGGFNAELWSAKGSSAFTKDAAASSEEVKKEFREAVLKSSEEYKRDRTIEINTAESKDVEVEESGEISNPNDEIPVTFLFYELQRRYRVNEEIYRLTPVVLVAQEVPRPDEIDEDWLIAYDWILKRVILDDSFLPALVYLSTKTVGDEFALKELAKNVAQQREIVDALKEELVAEREQLGARYAALEKSIERRAQIAEGGDGGLLSDVGSFLADPLGLFFGDEGNRPEAARIREDAAKDAYERLAKEEKEMRARLERETTALNAITETYTKALSDHLNRKTQIERLRVHVKQNILYYMQAIWNYEPTDQRFFRLHKVRVPVFRGSRNYTLQPNPSSMGLIWPDRIGFKFGVHFNPAPLEFTTLAEVAELDTLLGYKGNYMIFPLKQSNDLTDFMMTPYVDSALGLHDPDELGNWTLEDFAKYVCCLKQHLPPEEFEQIRDELRSQYQQLLSAPRRSTDEIIVPTGSLFIEALPGVHPILEDFKLIHRAIDVKKVQAEVRNAELENIRGAARLLAGERGDPRVDKKIVIEGESGVIVPPEGS
jgi:hypothetical protein